MSIDATNWAWSLQDISSTEKLILLSFADRAGETFEAWPSKKRLELDTCLCFNSVDKGIKSLVKKGYMIKTGEQKSQVPVYRLIGVIPREAKSPPPKNNPPPKIGGSTPPKNTPPTPPKYGIQNHQLNPKRNPKAEQAPDSIFFLIQNLSIQEPISKDLCKQVAFYAEQSIDKQPVEQSVRVALSLIRTKKWKIPSGYKGITSQSIAKKENDHEEAKKVQYIEDAKIMRGIKTKVIGDNITQMKEMLK